MAEFNIELTSPEGDSDVSSTPEPLVIFELIRKMRVGAAIVINRTD